MIRLATARDVPEIATLFHRAVRDISRYDYTPEQIAAWAGPAPDELKWQNRQASRTTFVMEQNGVIQGFVELTAAGHIDACYVHPDHVRHGIGRALLQHAEARRREASHLFAEASITALPFFLAQGFITVAEQDVVYQGAVFRNYRMTKPLQP